MKKFVSLVLASCSAWAAFPLWRAEAWTVTCPWVWVRRCRDGQPEGRVAFHHLQPGLCPLLVNAERATPPPSIAGWPSTPRPIRRCGQLHRRGHVRHHCDPRSGTHELHLRRFWVCWKPTPPSSSPAQPAKSWASPPSTRWRRIWSEGNQIMVGTNGATGSEAFSGRRADGAMGYGDQFTWLYESAAEAAQAVARGEDMFIDLKNDDLLEKLSRYDLLIKAVMEESFLEPQEAKRLLSNTIFIWKHYRCFRLRRFGCRFRRHNYS